MSEDNPIWAVLFVSFSTCVLIAMIIFMFLFSGCTPAIEAELMHEAVVVIELVEKEIENE